MDFISQLQGYYDTISSLDDIEEARKIIEMFDDDEECDETKDD